MADRLVPLNSPFASIVDVIGRAATEVDEARNLLGYDTPREREAQEALARAMRMLELTCRTLNAFTSWVPGLYEAYADSLKHTPGEDEKEDLERWLG